MKKLSCLLILLIFNGCSVNPVTGQQDFVMMSENQEISLGKKYHAQVLQQTHRLQRSRITKLCAKNRRLFIH